MKNGVMKRTMKPTPIIHTCTTIILSSKNHLDYSDNFATIRQKNPRLPVLWCTIPKNRTASSQPFHTSDENKPQISGKFLTTTQRGVFPPQKPRNQPYRHHKNATLKTRRIQNPLKKPRKTPDSRPIPPSKKNHQNSDIK
jgi:hypothetical protein